MVFRGYVQLSNVRKKLSNFTYIKREASNDKTGGIDCEYMNLNKGYADVLATFKFAIINKVFLNV